MTKERTTPFDLLRLEDLLSQDERDVQAAVRSMVDEHVRPHIAEWFEAGTLPARDLALEFGKLGVLGMHLEGYGCAGMNATAYGVACLEVEAGDSGVRSMVSVQGSLAMFAIHRFGSEAQKQEWLPRMAAGEAIGCFGLTEPDHGSDPSGMRTRARRDGEGERSDWVLDGAKMWITNGSVADVAIVWAQTDDGVRGFVVPTDAPGFSAPQIKHKLSMRASVTSELVLEGVRLPYDAVLPEVRGLKGPLSCLTEARFGIVWGVLGAARDCLETAIAYAVDRTQFDRPIAGFQLTQAKLADMALELDKAFLLAHHLGPGQGGRHGDADHGQRRQAQQRPRGAGHRPHLPDHPRRQRHLAGVPGAAARQQPRVGADLRRHLRGPHACRRASVDRHRCVPVSRA